MKSPEFGAIIAQRALDQGMESEELAKIVGYMLIELLEDVNSNAMQITIDNQRYNIAIKRLD